MNSEEIPRKFVQLVLFVKGLHIKRVPHTQSAIEFFVGTYGVMCDGEIIFIHYHFGHVWPFLFLIPSSVPWEYIAAFRIKILPMNFIYSGCVRLRPRTVVHGNGGSN